MAQPRARRARPKKDSPGLRIRLQGRTYTVRQADLTPRLIAELRRETGFAGFTGLASEMARGFDVDVLAALIWLARRIDGETVDYESLLDSMDRDVEVEVEPLGAGTPDSEPGPADGDETTSDGHPEA